MAAILFLGYGEGNWIVLLSKHMIKKRKMKDPSHIPSLFATPHKGYIISCIDRVDALFQWDAETAVQYPLFHYILLHLSE